ncbi:FAD/NAD-P-binding domain-containing protein [Daedaleopsis nitida]|nr:FAD/NAD-P-binding domain-containing protein [Daedaleopsis nitida]
MSGQATRHQPKPSAHYVERRCNSRGDQRPQIYSDFKLEHNIEPITNTNGNNHQDNPSHPHLRWRSERSRPLAHSSRRIPATLYERESGYSSRAHLGGTLDLDWTSGQRALSENGLQEEFDKHSRPEGQEMKIGDAEGNIIFSRGREGAADPEKKRPEIDRGVLRKFLLDAVPSESVKWGHSLTSARALGAGKHELTFSNGATVQCDILVGADGANSRVQPLVSPATPIYSGITGAEISIAPEIVAQDDLKAIRELVGQGSLFSLGSNKFLGAQMNGDGRIRTYAWFRGPEDWRLPQTPNEARRVLLDTCAPEGWSPTLLQLIERCDDAAIYLRSLYYLPVATPHLMTSFAGGAANIGMLDGLELGLALVDAIAGGKTDKEREAAIAAFEKTMFERAEKMAVFANANMEAFFRPDAAKAIVERAKAVIKEGMPGHKANAA